MLFFGKNRELNLIPEEQRAQRTKRIRFTSLVGVSLVLSLVILSYVGLTILVLNENNTKRNLEDELQQKNSEWQEIAPKASNVKVIKSKISEYQTFSGQYFNIDDKVDSISKAVPKGITLDVLELDSQGKAILEGSAKGPTDIMQFVSVLSSDDTFSVPQLTSAEKLFDGGYAFSLTVVINK